MSYPIRRLSRTPEGNSATQSLVTNCSGSGENCSGIHHLDLEALDTAVGTPSFLIILVSNGIVIYLVSKSWTSRRRQSVPNLLVLALAATDFLTGLMGYPPRLLSFYSGQWLGGKMMCHFTSFIFSFFLTTSQCIVVLMGVERYLSMEKPFFYQNYCTVNRCAALLVVVWLYSTMVAGAGIAMEEVHDNSGQADRAKKYGCYNLPCTQLGPYRTTNAKIFALWTLIQGLFFICVLLISNVVVIKAIKVLEEKAATCCPRSKEEYMRQMDMIKGIHREFSRLMQVINVVFSLCLLPTLVGMPTKT